MVRVPRKIEFTKGRLRGSGVGMTYDQTREVLWLLDQAQITMAPEKGKDPGLKIVAGAAGMARREKYFRFDRGFNATREGRILSSESAMAYLTDDEERLKSLELRGNARIVMSGAIEGGLQSMTAREINLEYGDDGETLEHAVLAGDGVMQLAGAGGQPGRRISRQSDRRDRRSCRCGDLTGCARPRRAVAAGDQGRSRARDSVREHERHRRARQGPHRRAVQPQRGVSRTARGRHAASGAFADTLGGPRRQRRRRRRELRGGHDVRGRRHAGPLAGGALSGGERAVAAGR